MKIVIAGGSGQVGTLLARQLSAHGHSLTLLSRRAAPSTVFWDGRTDGPWTRSLEGSDVCINLAGRSVNCRYNAANRQAILASRIDSTRILGEAIGAAKSPPRVWLNASTATLYRHALDRPMDEATGELGGSEPGAPDSWNFSIEVARAWEEALYAAPTPRTRRVALRSAMTFSPDAGGVFSVLMGLVRVGLGGRQGDGRQYISWIHELDFGRAVELLMEEESWEGPVNLAAPEPLPNAEFFQILRQAAGVRIGLPSPAWMLEIGTWLMRTESELVLKSRRVVPGRLLDAGFVFRYPHWPEAARELVSRSH